MIRKLRGHIDTLELTEAIVDVGGVGFRLAIPLSTRQALAEAGLGAGYDGIHVAVQGAGHVGAALVRHLLDAGATVTVADIHADLLEPLQELGAAVAPAELFRHAGQVARGGEIAGPRGELSREVLAPRRDLAHAPLPVDLPEDRLPGRVERDRPLRRQQRPRPPHRVEMQPHPARQDRPNPRRDHSAALASSPSPGTHAPGEIRPGVT